VTSAWVCCSRIVFRRLPQAPDVPLGAGGTLTIYTDHGKSVNIIS